MPKKNMSYIENIIASIPTMSRGKREEWASKAETTLKKSPGHDEALRLLEALAAVEASRPPEDRLEVTGELAWEKHRHGETTFRAFYDDQIVGKIFKGANHSGADKDVYSVEIRGQIVADAIHHIEDARSIGEQAFRELAEKTEL